MQMLKRRTQETYSCMDIILTRSCVASCGLMIAQQFRNMHLVQHFEK